MLPFDLPWRRGGGDASDSETATTDSETADIDSEVDVEEQDSHSDALVVCEFQDGTLAVFEDEVRIERVSRSKFDDKTIPLRDVVGVEYADGITIGYVQIEQRGVETSTGGLLSDPVDENTLHFGRGDRECAKSARDEILQRAGG